ncbi:MAG: rhodanese-like domain-containing protein [Bacteroidetes bacterium]|nr:rhodanese-like domain-containing protein [Bacteroidota bacterium]
MSVTQFLLYAVLLLIVVVYARRFFLTRVVKRYSAIQLRDRLGEGDVVLLDVRTDQEFGRGSISGAIHIPSHELTRRAEELKRFAGKEIVCYCQSGNRSLMAAARLGRMGFRAANLEGGIAEWNFAQRQKG